jgi:hypothetical protein
MTTNLWTNVEELGDFSHSDYAYDAVKTASYMLWALSGRKFSGTTTVTERYTCTYDPYLRVGGSSLNYYPALINGQVVNFPGGQLDRGSDHEMMADGTSLHSKLRLRGRKVIKIHTVRNTDGTIVPPSQYYLQDHSVLQGAPNAGWLACNIEVTYTYGTPPPTAGRAAAKILATELVKLYEGDDTCALPQRVTSVARQGVSYTILDNQDFIDELKTGIYAVDLFLRASNPDKARARARVFTPDTPRARRTVPEIPIIPTSSFDLIVNADGGAVLLYLDELGAEFLTEDTSWRLYSTVSNYDNTNTQELENSTVLDKILGTITVSSSYDDLLKILGPRNPGILTVYATRPSLGNPEIDEIINLVESNAIIRLGERVTPIRLI